MQTLSQRSWECIQNIINRSTQKILVLVYTVYFLAPVTYRHLAHRVAEATDRLPRHFPAGPPDNTIHAIFYRWGTASCAILSLIAGIIKFETIHGSKTAYEINSTSLVCLAICWYAGFFLLCISYARSMQPVTSSVTSDNEQSGYAESPAHAVNRRRLQEAPQNLYRELHDLEKEDALSPVILQLSVSSKSLSSLWDLPQLDGPRERRDNRPEDRPLCGASKNSPPLLQPGLAPVSINSKNSRTDTTDDSARFADLNNTAQPPPLPTRYDSFPPLPNATSHTQQEQPLASDTPPSKKPTRKGTILQGWWPFKGRSTSNGSIAASTNTSKEGTAVKEKCTPATSLEMPQAANPGKSAENCSDSDSPLSSTNSSSFSGSSSPAKPGILQRIPIWPFKRTQSAIIKEEKELQRADGNDSLAILPDVPPVSRRMSDEEPLILQGITPRPTQSTLGSASSVISNLIVRPRTWPLNLFAKQKSGAVSSPQAPPTSASAAAEAIAAARTAAAAAAADTEADAVAGAPSHHQRISSGTEHSATSVDSSVDGIFEGKSVRRARYNNTYEPSSSNFENDQRYRPWRLERADNGRSHRGYRHLPGVHLPTVEGLTGYDRREWRSWRSDFRTRIASIVEEDDRRRAEAKEQGKDDKEKAREKDRAAEPKSALTKRIMPMRRLPMRRKINENTDVRKDMDKLLREMKERIAAGKPKIVKPIEGKGTRAEEESSRAPPPRAVSLFEQPLHKTEDSGASFEDETFSEPNLGPRPDLKRAQSETYLEQLERDDQRRLRQQGHILHFHESWPRAQFTCKPYQKTAGHISGGEILAVGYFLTRAVHEIPAEEMLDQRIKKGWRRGSRTEA